MIGRHSIYADEKKQNEMVKRIMKGEQKVIRLISSTILLFILPLFFKFSLITQSLCSLSVADIYANREIILRSISIVHNKQCNAINIQLLFSLNGIQLLSFIKAHELIFKELVINRYRFVFLFLFSFFLFFLYSSRPI